MKIRVRYHDNAGEVQQGISRWFRISATLLSMSAVALLSALVSMRLAIHAGEVDVPNLQGLTLNEASDLAHSSKLNLSIENRFYSLTVPAGRVLSQSPSPGATVRKGWHMRITESMGPQRVPIPDVIGMSEHDAAAKIRHAALDLGALAHLPAPGTPDMVLAQTPPPNAEGVDKPEVSILLSDPETAATKAWVMPNLVGLSWSAANARMKEMDLHVWAIVPQPAPPPVVPNPDGSMPPPPPPPPPMVPAGVVVSQVPAAGARVSASDNPHVKMSAAALASPPANKPAPANGVTLPVQQKPAPVVRQTPAKTGQPVPPQRR